ncbi:MAG: glycoside hydrolase [Chitinophagaceae bacterium]|nr:MAG: glycoside hydrolase [Chitinophagaceae bacterium]
MKHASFTLFVFVLSCCFAVAQSGRIPEPKANVPLDSISLSDPYILADVKTNSYYMTGTGGLLWKSRDLRSWEGPYKVAQTDSTSWMGPAPMIWAAEIHEYKGKYYYFATFTNRAVKIDTVGTEVIERRACHVLVSDKPGGPFTPMTDPTYLPADMPTLDGTLWIENDKPYLVYCYEWLQNGNGTIESIEMKPDLSGTTGKSKLLFRAKDAPWNRQKNENGTEGPNKVTDGPFLFKTGTGKIAGPALKL